MRLIVATLAALAALWTMPAQTEEDLHSGNYMVPKCEAWLGLKDRDSLQKEIERGNADSAGVSTMFGDHKRNWRVLWGQSDVSARAKTVSVN